MKILNELMCALLITAGTISLLFLVLLISMHREHKHNEKKKEK
jgi:hypothetical protein